MEKKWQLLLTCEHGGNQIPRRYGNSFAGRTAQKLLNSHRGWDEGALMIARRLKRSLNCPLISSQTSRLLIDLNRSLSHPKVFSELTRPLPVISKSEIIARHYLPYRQAVENWIDQRLQTGRSVAHFSIHSLTPILNGEVRNADIAFLYDPRRKSESETCHKLRRLLHATHPSLKIRMNYPYRGTADGLTTRLRKEYPAARYTGVEIEFNQAFIRNGLTAAHLNSLARFIGTLHLSR